jgi:hypothetical protein
LQRPVLHLDEKLPTMRNCRGEGHEDRRTALRGYVASGTEGGSTLKVHPSRSWVKYTVTVVG